jgi:hypothetical protein
MENTDKSGPHAPASRLREALEGAFDAAEASENAARSAPGDAAARPLAPLGHRTRSGALFPIPGTGPRRQRATGRGPQRRGRPALPRPSRSAVSTTG